MINSAVHRFSEITKHWDGALKAIMPTISWLIFLRKAGSENIKGTVL